MLSHAELPFVGRRQEIELILSFYRGAKNADSFSVLWIEGEAGIGKTRLLKHVAEQIDESGSLLFHLRLYPDTPSTIGELLEHTLESAIHVRHLLKHSRATSIAAKIRHLARLKPTTLILEDLHLLSEVGAQDLFSIFNALAEEPVCIICASRLGEHPATQRLYSYVNSRVELKPLKSEDIEQLLDVFPDLASSTKIVRTLHEVSNGIPLVLRSVLAAIPNGERIGSHSGLEPIINRLIEHNAKASVQSLTTGLTAQLLSDEYKSACALASLGEVFSEEAAQIVLSAGSTSLTTLSEKGIITQVRDSLIPVIGKTSLGLPWRFTHTLLRDELGRESTISVETVLALLGADVPLYATTLLHELSSREIIDHGKLLLRVHQLIISLVDKTGLDYHFSLRYELSSIAVTFIQRNLTLLTEQEEINADLDLTRMVYYRWASLPGLDPSEISTTANVYLEKTQSPKQLIEAEHRLIALAAVLHQGHYVPLRQDSLTITSCLNEAEDLIGTFPGLVNRDLLVHFLISLATGIRNSLRPKLISRLRQHLSLVLDAQGEKSGVDRQYIHSFVAAMLSLFITEEEAEDRIQLAEQILATHELHELPERFSVSYVRLLVNSGRMHKASEVLKQLTSSSLVQTSHSAYVRFYHATESILVDVAFGAPPSYIEERLHKTVKWIQNADPEYAEAYSEISFWDTLVTALYIREDKSWGESVITKYTPQFSSENSHSVHARFPFLFGDLKEIREAVDQMPHVPQPFKTFIRLAAADNVDMESIERVANSLLENNSVNRYFVDLTRYTIIVIEDLFADNQRPIPDSLREAIEGALRRMLLWCKKGDLVGYMKPILQRARNYFDRSEHDYWADALVSAQQSVSDRFQWHSESARLADRSRLQISMLGQIAVSTGHEPPKRVQGARARAMLGLMIANELSGRRLSYKGFREVIFGTVAEPVDSTANIRAAIARLRSILGKECIVTDGKSAPTLNLDLVEVDIVRISRSLDECKQAIRAQYPRRARQLMTGILDSNFFGPAYPTLYDDFFESARTDFELHLRSTLFSLADLLKQEGDLEGVTAVIEEGLERLPGDEELLALLSDTLALSGRTIEALSIRNSWHEV